MRRYVRLLTWNIWFIFFLSAAGYASQGVRHEKLSDAHLTVLGFTIGQSTLDDVQKAFGKATLLPRREQAPNQICYISKQENDGTILLFEAGPMGGWDKLTSITILSRNALFNERSNCTSSALVSKNISTRGGLKLGLDRTGLKALLGEPTQSRENTLLYEFRTRERMTEKQIQKLAKLWPKVGEDPFMDVSSDVEATFLGSELVSMSISKIETY